MPDLDVDSLGNKERLVYGIEEILSEDVDVELEYPRKNYQSPQSPRIANRDLYKIYKALCEMKGVKQRIVYTGNSILEDWEDREDLEGEIIEDFEPTLNFE